jgi:hypothetical protein
MFVGYSLRYADNTMYVGSKVKEGTFNSGYLMVE